MLVTVVLLTAFADVRADAPAPREAGIVTAEYGGQSLVCDAVEQRYTTEKRQINGRTLNLLLFDAAGKGCLDLIDRFLAEGASVGARDRFGNTALLHAARSGQNDAVTLLLDKESDLHRQNLAGSTALLRAASANRRRTVKALLARGADPNTTNRQGVTPLLAAAFNGYEALPTDARGARSSVSGVPCSNQNPSRAARSRTRDSSSGRRLPSRHSSGWPGRSSSRCCLPR